MMKKSTQWKSLSRMIVFFFLFTVNSLFSFSQSGDSTKAMIQNRKIGRSINLGNALEAPDIGQWGVDLKEEYFQLIAEKGFNSVRVPIRWNTHAGYTAPYAISESFFQVIDWVIENSIKNGLYVIINFHHYDELYEDPDGHTQRFLALWQQVCNRYAGYSDSLIFEILNEPHGNLTVTKWNSLLASAYTQIRSSHPERTIIVAPADWGGISALNNLIIPANDDNLILTVHYYNPFQFTHQGAEWADGSDAWLGTKWRNTLAERLQVQYDMERVSSYSQEHHIPVFMGEFGAYSKADLQSRVRWTNYIARFFEEQGFSWAYWEFCSGFGIYNATYKAWNEGLLYALLYMPMSNAVDGNIPEDPGNLITNGDFADSADFWYLYVNQSASASFQVINGEAKISLESGVTQNSNIALINSDLQLQYLKPYHVSFDAYATENRPVEVSICQGTDPWIWTSYSGNRSFNLTTERTTYHFYFTMPSGTDQNSRFRLNTGISEADVYLDNVVVEDLGNFSDTTKNKVKFLVKDIETEMNLDNCEVIIMEDTVYTSSEGIAEVEHIQVGYHPVQIAKKHYNTLIKNDIAIYSDTTIILYLTKRLYQDTIRLIDERSNTGISLVPVTINSLTKKTDQSGEVIFSLPYGTYELSTGMEGYLNQQDSMHTVSSDTLRIFRLLKTHAGIKFKISVGNQPINNANVVIGNDSMTTNNIGIAVSDPLPLFDTYPFSISKYGYRAIHDTLFLNNDTSVSYSMEKTLIYVKFQIYKDGKPIEKALIICNGDTSYSSSFGEAGFYNLPVAVTYDYSIQKNGFLSVNDQVYAAGDTNIIVSMVLTSVQDFTNEAIRMYPNPAGGFIRIESDYFIKFVEIFDMKGNHVYATEVNKQEFDLDLSTLDPGHYFIRVVQNDNAGEIHRFIKTE
jgi:endoglucanase